MEKQRKRGKAKDEEQNGKGKRARWREKARATSPPELSLSCDFHTFQHYVSMRMIKANICILCIV